MNTPDTHIPKRSHGDIIPREMSPKYIAVYSNMTLYATAPSFSRFAEDILCRYMDVEMDPLYLISPEYGRTEYNAYLFHECFAIGRITEAQLIQLLNS